MSNIDNTSNEKVKLQLSTQDGRNSIAIDWDVIPEDVINSISDDYFYDILAINSNDVIETKTVIYFRKVSKFRKDVKVFESDKIDFGV